MECLKKMVGAKVRLDHHLPRAGRGAAVGARVAELRPSAVYAAAASDNTAAE